ncbi:MAG: TPD domain-containing protein [Candidatus Thermoplasmatota archaeon]|nr:TPD domain-containing protein [Candidatus Thermoplasmatota archaeon]
MKREVYNRIYSGLRRYSDVDRIVEQENVDWEVAFVLYSQKTVRNATKRYHVIKRAAPALVRRWKKGESFVQIGESENFPPMLLAFIMVQEMGYSKKMFWAFVKNERRSPTPRMFHELQDARRIDKLYSPEANAIQDERGKRGEAQLAKWLDAKDICYRTEEDLRCDAAHQKTPDFLLDKPLLLDGFKIHWFESKAIFADDVEYRRHLKNQIMPYYELHGTGAVAYWLGRLDDMVVPEQIRLFGPEFFGGFPPPPCEIFEMKK